MTEGARTELSVVDRVAMAIASSIDDGRFYTSPSFQSAARAAIRAMREPSEAMIDSGVAFALNVSLGGDYRWSQYVRDKHQSMIDAALSAEAVG